MTREEAEAALAELSGELVRCYPSVNPEVFLGPLRKALEAPGSVAPEALIACFEQLEDLFEAGILRPDVE